MQTLLSQKQQAIIPVAAFAARGDIALLNTALDEALNVGITVNEAKEVLVQLYAYAGFPRSLNALGALMALVKHRQQQGLNDETGRDATPVSCHENSLETGTRNQTQLVGQPVSGPLFDFAPAIDQFLKSHLFGDIFMRDTLDWQTRELATISALAALSGVNSQLKSHFSMSLNTGLTAGQLWDFIKVLERQLGSAVAANASAVLAEVIPRPQTHHVIKENTMTAQFDGNGIFPKGPKNEAYAQYFQGTSYLNMLSTEGVKVGNVVFEPGCRNHWHIHHKGGQILLVTGGHGWYQQWNQPARRLHAGDVVNIPAGAKHWHGAAADSWFAHIAIEVPAEGGSTEWLEPVSEQDYRALS
ncbi:cupin domain-containing protein [Enterobacteriaceae bacterium 4M9]|nr:cupin domain-containing protein [Enterobacteriaceae bacterium 4M9]